MGGIKRKEAPSGAVKSEKKQKTTDSKPKYEKPAKRSHLEDAANEDDDEEESDHPEEKTQKSGKQDDKTNGASKQFKLETTSAEAHAKQRQLAKERKAAKPHADVIQRSKQLWERLRRKSHVPKEERAELLSELFSIIDGRVRDFVFKHDSVRVIQCAIKYAKPEQLKKIVKELQYDMRELAESKYGKFLVAKMIMQGDREDKDTIIPQFYGHVRRLINHPEAAWIVDDIYRQVATPPQKAMMLREWYGAEYALFAKQRPNASTEGVTADLKKILEESPEKRKPNLAYLREFINKLVQNKKNGFTMLHDAMLQYFLALEVGSEEHSEFMEILKGDIDAEESDGGGDLFRNLAFTKDGSRLVALVLAYGSAKDRKVILKCYKDNIDAMSFDPHAKMVLIAGLDIPDDTKMTSQSVLRELLGLQMEDTTPRFDRLETMITDLNARLPILYPMTGVQKWLVKDHEKALIEEIHAIRGTTSKKAPEVRRSELISHISAPLLEFIADRAPNLVQTSFGTQAVTEILLECHDKDSKLRTAAKEAVAQLAEGDPLEEGHIAQDAAVGRMLKTLVLGGPFDPATKKAKVADPALGFADALYPVIKDHIVDWACSDSSFVVVALLESEDVSKSVKKDVEKALKCGKKQITKAAEEGNGSKRKAEEAAAADGEDGKKSKKRKVEKAKPKGNAGAKILLEKL